MKFFVFIILLINLIELNNAVLTPLVPSEDYANTIVVDENNPNQYLLLWKLINQDEIQFEAHVKQLNKILSILNIFYIKIGKNNWLDRLRVVLKYKTSKF